MLKLKLKSFLSEHNLSRHDLERAVSTVAGSGQGLSERYLRYLLDNTEPLELNSPQRKPSLVTLGTLIEALEYLTGETVEFSDVLEHSKGTNGAVADSPRLGPPPRHLAFIVDGNRRWARAHELSFYDAYKIAGGNLVQNVCTAADQGVAHMTAFLFSSENWKRDPDEVDAVFASFTEIIYQYTPTFSANGIRTRAIGDLAGLPTPVRSALEHAAEETKACSRCTFAMAFNYGGRWDILEAVKQLVAEGSTGGLTEEALRESLSTAESGDPDLLIRTGGARRVSNFMLWQLAYTELHFSTLLWPDFTPGRLLEALRSYRAGERRFGA